MPELPEVETIRIGLSQKIIGLKIKDIEVLNPKTFHGDKEKIIGSEVKSVFRKAKVLGIQLESDLTLLFHLKMSGQVIFSSKNFKLAGGHPTQDMKDALPNTSTRVIFTFSDNSKLFFNDQRKFGWIKVVDSERIAEDSFLKNLGPEPLEKEFTLQVLKEQLLKRKNWAVKVAIMDQTLLSGVGNIYASEACFNAKIDPQAKVKDLTDAQFEKLHAGIIKSLKDGIKYGGSTRAHFVNTDGEKGLFLDYAFVYGREGEGCKVCGEVVKRVVQGGRSTFYCPNCQK